MQAPVDRSKRTESSMRMPSYVGFFIYVVAGLVYLASGLLFVPGLWSVPLWGGWLMGLWVVYRLMRRRSWWVIAATPVALVVLWAYLELGWARWGWAVEDLPLGVR